MEKTLLQTSRRKIVAPIVLLILKLLSVSNYDRVLRVFLVLSILAANVIATINKAD